MKGSVKKCSFTFVRRFFGAEKRNGKFGWSFKLSDDGGAKRFNEVGDEKWLINELLKSIWGKYGWWWWCTVWEKNGGSGADGIRRDSIARFSKNCPMDVGDVIWFARAKSWM